jgi:hypothetical protein
VKVYGLDHFPGEIKRPAFNLARRMVSRSAIHMPKIPMARQLGSMPTSKRCQHSPIRLDNTPSLSLVGAGRHPEITNQFRLNDRERVGELAYSISPQFGHSSSNARSDLGSIKQASKAVLIHGPGLNPNPLDSTMSVESSIISILLRQISKRFLSLAGPKNRPKYTSSGVYVPVGRAQEAP